MSATPNIYHYSKLSEKINQKYARTNHYDFIMMDLEMADRAPQWCKIKVIIDILTMSTKRYDYLFWIDADAIFNKHNITLESLIKNDPNADIIICDDIENSGRHNTINTGTFFVKCNEWSLKFFKDIWNYKGPLLFKPYHEQTVIEKYMEKNPRQKNIVVKPGTLFNTYINTQMYDKTINDNFIIHLMQMSSEYRVKFMSEWIKLNYNS